MSVIDAERARSRLRNLRSRRWSPAERAILIAALAIAMGGLFLTAYSLALGDPVPHRIDAALVGDRAAGAGTVDAVEHVARRSLVFRPYASVPAALHAIDEQRIYAALDLTSPTPRLYVASAAGASVARVLQGIYAIDPAVRVVDTHPLAANDPAGVDIFYLMLVTSVIGLTTVFQVRGQAGDLGLRHHISFVLLLALAGSLVLTGVDGPLLHRPAGAYPEEWGILALHLVAVASFASLMAVLIDRWAIVPTWLFFVVLGNASSGGAVSPPLLPQPFADLSQWLPSGATVTALRNAIYFRDYQHVRPLAVLGAWATGLFIVWLVVSHRRLAGAATLSARTAGPTTGPA
jgi:hypothetical protein